MTTPAHVAIIMDGNGRWAKARGLPRLAGHRAGVEALRKAVRAAPELGISYLTVYAFSSENWSRPKTEVSDLMGLLKLFIRRDLAELHQSGVRVRIIGDREGLQPDIRGPARRGRNADRRQQSADAGHRLQLWRPRRDRARRAQARRRPWRAARSTRARSPPKALPASSRHARHSRPGTGHPHQRRASAVELPACGRPPTANWSSCLATGPISAASISPRPARISPAASAASAAWAARRRVATGRWMSNLQLRVISAVVLAVVGALA